MQRPLVHIGMAKAASTFLQLELFPNLEEIHNLGKHKVDEDLKKAIAAITRRPSLSWRGQEDKFVETLQNGVKEAREAGKRPVLSDEDLSVYKFQDPDTMARRVHGILGDYDVLIMLRNPFSWLRSNYLFRLEHQNPIAVFGFEEWMNTHFQPQRIGSDVAEIWFGSLARTYKEACGGDVHLIPYELLRADPEEFARQLGAVMGVEPSKIMDRINAPEDKRAHKIRITTEQQEAYELFRWVELRQPEKFAEELIMLAGKAGHQIPPKHLVEMDRLLNEPELDRKAWAKLARQIILRWPGTTSASPEFSDEQEKMLKSVIHQSGKLLNNLGFEITLDYTP